MPSHTATNLCRAVAVGFGSLLAGCASGGDRYQPGALTAEQVAQCRAVELAYRNEAAEYPQLRDDLAADPAAVGWLVRMFVRDVFSVREGRPLGEDTELFRAVARIADPVEARAVAEIMHLGEAAVPTLVGDLLMHDQPQPRELGIELLAKIGAPAVPALREVAETGESRQQRAAARALGAIGIDASALRVLRRLATEADYTVRADALRSLRDGGPEARDLLIQRLRDDDDPFVRRVASQTLAWFPEPMVVHALVDSLERAMRSGEIPGETAAQAALQRIAGTRGMRSAAAWRSFADTMGQVAPPRVDGR